VDELFATTDLEVVACRTATQDIEFESPRHAASEMEQWSGGWGQLLDHLDSLQRGREARSALTEHLEQFGSGTASSFVLGADYVATVLRKRR
jgi:hypothetical protein